jgi:hypothetical protein
MVVAVNVVSSFLLLVSFACSSYFAVHSCVQSKSNFHSVFSNPLIIPISLIVGLALDYPSICKASVSMPHHNRSQSSERPRTTAHALTTPRFELIIWFPADISTLDYCKAPPSSLPRDIL